MKQHRLDAVSLTFALIFLAVAGWWLLAQLLDLTLPAVGWFVAGGLIVFGLLGLLGALRSARAEPAPTVVTANLIPAGSPAVVSTPPVSSAPPAGAGAPGADDPTEPRLEEPERRDP